MLQLMVESAPSPLLMVDAQGSIVLANAQAEQLFGYRREELLGRPIDMLVPERYRGRHPGQREGFFANPSRRAMGERRDLYALRKDGSEVPVEIGLTSIETPAGPCVLAAMIDISVRRRLEQERSESEQRYVDLVEQSINGFVVRSPDGRLLLVNDAYCRMTGYTRKELLRLSAQDMVVDQTVLARVAGLAPGESVRIETLMKCKGGATREVEYVTQRLEDGNLQSVILDISERMRSERARDESERRYAELVDQALEGITVRKSSGEFLFVNDTFCRMLGYTRAELLRMGIRDVVHPEDAGTIAQVQQLKSGASLRLEKRMCRKDGQVLHVQVSARRLASGDIQSTIQDVTDSRRAEERFRAMVVGSPSAMLMVNAEGRILLVNPQTEKLFGYRQEELLGKPVEMLIPAGMRGQHPALRAGFQRNPQIRTMGQGRELFGLHKDGHQLPVEIGLNPVITHEGQCVMASVIDITERLRAQETLRSLPKQLLDAQEAERRRIARELHDEVGQALTASQIKLQDLEAQLRGAAGAQDAAEISAMVAHLLQQVRQLSLDLRPSVLDDLGLASAIRWFVRERVPQGKMRVEVDVPLTLPRAPVAVETALFRAFQSAITNVLRHAEANVIRVSLGYAAPHLTLEVRDDGKGFDLDTARRRARQGGSLGLLGMEEWIRLSGGEILIQSAPGTGTVVRAIVMLQPMDDTGQTAKGG